VDSPTQEVTSSCRILLVVGTSYCSTRYYQTISALQMYKTESKRRSHTMVCRLCTTALGPDNNICAWSSGKTSRWCIVERKLMAYVQAWYIDQLEKFSLHEQDILFPVAHKDYQSHCNLRPSHLVKLPTSCPIVKLVALHHQMHLSISYQAVYVESSLAHKYCFVVFITLLGNVCFTSNRFVVMTILHCRCYPLFAI